MPTFFDRPGGSSGGAKEYVVGTLEDVSEYEEVTLDFEPSYIIAYFTGGFSKHADLYIPGVGGSSYIWGSGKTYSFAGDCVYMAFK